MSKQLWFFFSDDKMSFYTKKCVAESSWEKKIITLWDQIIVRDNVLHRILVASINNVMTFSAYHTSIVTCM